MPNEVSDGMTDLSPREARRLERLNLTRSHILDTAEDIFGKRGYHATSLKDVSEQSGYSVGTIYTFYASKDDLYAAAVERHGGDEVPLMVEVIERGGPAIDRLVDLAEMQINYFRKYAGWGRLMTQIMTPAIQLEETHNPALRGFAEGYMHALKIEGDLLAEGQADATIRGGNVEALARMFSALVTSFHIRDFEPTESEGTPDLGEFLDFIRDAFGTGVR